MKTKKRIIILLSQVVIVLIVFATLLFTGIIDIINEDYIINEDIPEVIAEGPLKQEERQMWLDNKAINDDYVGELIFDSGLINKSFVQAKSPYDENGDLYHFYTENGQLVSDGTNYNGNDVYIWTNWKDMSYDYNIEGGSVFMDYRNSLDDQNIIIYGHHFSDFAGNDPDRNKAFTPLEKLLDSSNYEANKTLRLVLDNETRSYELVGTYLFDVNDNYYLNNLQYYRTEYNYDEYENVKDESYYDNYINAMQRIKKYDTDLNLTSSDSTLTLQTCVSGRDGQLYEICVFKQVNVEVYE